MPCTTFRKVASQPNLHIDCRPSIRELYILLFLSSPYMEIIGWHVSLYTHVPIGLTDLQCGRAARRTYQSLFSSGSSFFSLEQLYIKNWNKPSIWIPMKESIITVILWYWESNLSKLTDPHFIQHFVASMQLYTRLHHVKNWKEPLGSTLRAFHIFIPLVGARSSFNATKITTIHTTLI